MQLVQPGIRTIVLSTGVTAASSGSWRFLGAAYTKFTLRCVRATSIGTSAFSVSLRGSLSTKNTTGAAVGAIPAYTPSTLIAAYTQASPGPGKLKVSTGGLPASHIKYVVNSMTGAGGRALRIEVTCVP